MRRVLLSYGTRPLSIEVADDSVIALPPDRAPADSVARLIESALDHPIGAQTLERAAANIRSALFIVSDATRSEPRNEMLEALRRRLPAGATVRVAIANGTHAPSSPGVLRLPDWAKSPINHDSRDPSNIADLGTTSRGTPLRINRCVLDSDLIIATGSIRPHYFAGFSGGIKALFPGLGENAAIRQNHRLKAAPGAISGNLQANPCRDDLEEIAARTAPIYLLNVAGDTSDRVHAAVSGDVVAAHREGARRCGSLFRLSAPPSPLVIVSDGLPISASLYQACKMVAAVAPVCVAGGRVLVAAECPDGVGGDGDPEVVNRAIFALGIAPRLPDGCRVELVSKTLKSLESRLFCAVHERFPEVEGPALVFPRAGASLLIDAQ